MYGRVYQWIHLGVVLSVLEVIAWFLYAALIDTGLFRLSISSCVNFGYFVLLETGLFHLGYQICGHRIVHSIPFFLYCQCL